VIGTIITPAGTRTYVVEELPEFMTDPCAVAVAARTARRRVRGVLVVLGAALLLTALLGFGWVGSALALRPSRMSVRSVRPTAALLALGPAELLGAAPAFSASSRAGAQQP
jgi:hypothetical protein